MLFTQVILNTVLKICSLPKAVRCFARKSRPELSQKSKIHIKSQRQRGMTFIEVLVALFILTTGIIGAVAMQATVKKGSFDAMQRSVASALAQDIIERMRSNDNDVTVLESYQGTYGNSSQSLPAVRCNSQINTCTPQQMVTNDLYEWERKIMGADTFKGEQNKGGLIEARGCINHLSNQVTVIISWQSRTASKDGADSDDTLSSNCGTATDKRRQVTVNAFIY